MYCGLKPHSCKTYSSCSAYTSSLLTYTYFTTSSLLFLTFARLAFLSCTDLYHIGKSITLAKSYWSSFNISSNWRGSNHSIGQLSISREAQVIITNHAAIYICLSNQWSISSWSLPDIYHLVICSYPANDSRVTPLVSMILCIYVLTCSDGSLVSLHSTRRWLQSVIWVWWYAWGKSDSFTAWSLTTTSPHPSSHKLLGAKRKASVIWSRSSSGIFLLVSNFLVAYLRVSGCDIYM